MPQAGMRADRVIMMHPNAAKLTHSLSVYVTRLDNPWPTYRIWMWPCLTCWSNHTPPPATPPRRPSHHPFYTQRWKLAECRERENAFCCQNVNVGLTGKFAVVRRWELLVMSATSAGFVSLSALGMYHLQTGCAQRLTYSCSFFLILKVVGAFSWQCHWSEESKEEEEERGEEEEEEVDPSC